MKGEQGMTRGGRRLIEDFLLPALDNQRYGDRLKWVDKDNLYFSIKWSHKNAAKWSLEDTVVFQDWDRLKGHFHPEIKGYYMQAKQRFRAALYKLNTVRKVSSTNKYTKVYQLILDSDKKKNCDFPGMKQDVKDYRASEGIPTSVICVNEHYVPLSKSRESSSSPPLRMEAEEEKATKPMKYYKHLPNAFPGIISLNQICDFSNNSDGGSEEDSTTTSIQQSEIKFEIKVEDDPEVDSKKDIVVTPPRHQLHIPVQLVPQYSRFSSQPLQQKPAHSRVLMPIQQSDICNKSVVEQMDSCEEALNLSMKPDKYKPVSAALCPVSAR